MQGIYKITNNINGRCYIGQSVDIKHRWYHHKYLSLHPELADGGYPIYRAIRKYGIDNFTFEILEEVQASALLTEKEQHYMDLYRNTNLYNVREAEENASVALSHPVYQIEPVTLKIITQYASMRKAELALNIGANTIYRITQGDGQTAGGYHWCKVEDWTQDWKPSKDGRGFVGKKTVALINPTTDVTLLWFDSMREAVLMVLSDQKFSAAYKSVSRICNGIGKTAYGYKWAFKEE